MQFLKSGLPGAVFLLSLGCYGARPQIQPEFTWIQQVGGTRQVLRALVSNGSAGDSGTCPEVKIDGQLAKMQIRFEKHPPDFAVTVCQSELPKSFSRVEVGGVSLVAKKKALTKVAVIGDTGCVRKRSKEQQIENQNCTDSKEWPFPEIAKQVGEWNPDLVIHVGDYIYRENLCPMDQPNCADGKLRDRWLGWKEDFFKSAQPLLTKAPWIFTRGNHEKCKKASSGWFAFLDPAAQSAPASCEAFTDPYLVQLEKMGILVLDTSSESEFEPKSALKSRFKMQLDLVAKARQANALESIWVVSHKPFWAVEPADPLKKLGQMPMSENLMSAAFQFPLQSVQLVLSGHVHSFQALSFEDKRAPQIVAGTSGARLHSEAIEGLPSLQYGGSRAKVGIHKPVHGFVTLERSSETAPWTVAQRTVQGKVLTECTLSSNELTNCVQYP